MTIQEALTSPHPPTAEMVLTTLINEIGEQPEPLVIVLDDYHVVEALAIQEGMIFLLDHLPHQLHLVIASRADPPWPLARLRARREVIELRAKELRFTPEEASTFLTMAMKLRLSPEDIRALEERTEGWIAGLQMAALSLQGREDAGNFISAFSGSNRYIFDCLVEEVLRHQSVELQEFLLKTAILERLNPLLCDALLERIDSQQVLSHLERANLFLIPLDEDRHWYRYHHLFASLLKSRLSQTIPEAIPDLYHRASKWCENASLVEEAVNYSILAGSETYTVELLERQILYAVAWGEFILVRSWLSHLPETTIRSRPILCVASGWIIPVVDDASQKLSESWMQAAEEGLTQNDSFSAFYRDTVLTNLAVFRIEQAHYYDWPTQELIKLCNDALDFVADRNPQVRSLLLVNLATFYLEAGDIQAADQTYHEAMQSGFASRNYLSALSALFDRMSYAYRLGKFTQALQICQEAMQSFIQPLEQTGIRPPDSARIYTLLGMILLERNDLPGAKEALYKTVDLFQNHRPTWLRAQSLYALARTLHGLGERETIPKFPHSLEIQLPEFANHYAAYQARIWILRASQEQNDFLKAFRWADAVQAVVGSREITYVEVLGLAQVRLAQSEIGPMPDFQPVLAMLDAKLLKAREKGWNFNIIEIQILRARVWQCGQDEQKAMAALDEALKLSEPEGLVRLFIDQGQAMEKLLKRCRLQAAGPLKSFIESLLLIFESAKPEHGCIQVGILIEPLSERELEVLHLLNTSLTSAEIAAKLYIAVSTVRTHIKSIYGKLNVNRRMDAILQAKRSGLI